MQALREQARALREQEQVLREREQALRERVPGQGCSAQPQQVQRVQLCR